MKALGIIAFLATFVMYGVSYASDVYINQSGADLDLNITQDGQTNKVGSSTEDFDLTGDDHTIDIDQLGNTNTISGSVDGDSQTLTISQDGDSNTSTVNVGTNASADDNSIIQDIEGNSNTTTVNVGTSAASGDADIDLTVEGDSNTVTINENSTAAMIGEDKKITNITLSGGSSDSNTVTSTHAGAGDHDTTLSHTGSDGTFSINQSGAHHTVVDLTTSGADASVTITVTD